MEESTKELKELIEKSSDANKSLLIFYISALAYIGLTVFSTSDEQIFQSNSHVRLPLLSVDLPLVAYYKIIPFIIIIIHYYVLIHIRHHLRLLQRWKNLVSTDNELLNPFILNFLISRRNSTGEVFKITFYHILANFIYFLFPLILLFAVQFKFASYHSYPITILHFLLVSGAFLLIRKTYCEIMTPYIPLRKSFWAGVSSGSHRFIFFLSAFHFIIFVLLLNHYIPRYFILLFKTIGILPYLLLTDTTLVRESPSEQWIEKYLMVTEKDDRQIKDLKEGFFLEFSKGFSLADRDFSYADFSGSTLTNSDFTGCILTGASFAKANLQGVRFDFAHMQKVNLEGADLTRASFREANLKKAFMQGVTCNKTYFKNTILIGCNLRAAMLRDSCDFDHAQLSGAELEEAHIMHGLFSLGDLRGVNMMNAWIDKSDFRKCDLRGSVLRGIIVSSSDFRAADFRASDLGAAYFQKTKLKGARFNGAIANIRCDTLSKSSLNLRGALVGQGYKVSAGSVFNNPFNPEFLGIRDKLAQSDNFIQWRMANLTSDTDPVYDSLQSRIRMLQETDEFQSWLNENLYGG